jgi:hypothetical protein
MILPLPDQLIQGSGDVLACDLREQRVPAGLAPDEVERAGRAGPVRTVPDRDRLSAGPGDGELSLAGQAGRRP